MRELRSIHDRITTWGFAGAAFCVGAIALSFWYEVISRYFLARPTVWAYEVASYALCAMIFLAMPEMSRRRAHIAVTYFADGLPERLRKQLAIAVIVATAAACFFCAWIAATETSRQFVSGTETASAMPIPKWWVSIFVPYGLLSSAFYFARQLFEAPPVIAVDEGY